MQGQGLQVQAGAKGTLISNGVITLTDAAGNEVFSSTSHTNTVPNAVPNAAG